MVFRPRTGTCVVTHNPHRGTGRPVVLRSTVSRGAGRRPPSRVIVGPISARPVRTFLDPPRGRCKGFGARFSGGPSGHRFVHRTTRGIPMSPTALWKKSVDDAPGATRPGRAADSDRTSDGHPPDRRRGRANREISRFPPASARLGTGPRTTRRELQRTVPPWNVAGETARDTRPRPPRPVDRGCGQELWTTRVTPRHGPPGSRQRAAPPGRTPRTRSPRRRRRPRPPGPAAASRPWRAAPAPGRGR